MVETKKTIWDRLPHVNLISLFQLEKAQKPMIFAVSIALVIVVNLLLATVSFRLDLSQGQAYTLSSSTKDILRNLDDLVNITFYVSSDLPTRIKPVKNDVQDLLNEYNRTTDKVNLEVVDPKRNEDAMSEANAAGISELQFSQLDRDQFAVQTGYFGIGIQFGEKQEAIPQVAQVENLEYNITSAIYKLTRAEDVKVGIIGKRPDMSAMLDPRMQQQAQDPQGIELLRQVLSQQYTVENVDISTAAAMTEIDPSLETLLIFDDNTTTYQDAELSKIKDYLRNKGSAIFFLDGLWVNEQAGLIANESMSNLPTIVRDWGITIQDNLVLSEAAELVSFAGGAEGFQTIRPYPLWIKTNNFNTDSPYFSNIQQMTFPWTSSVEINEQDGFTTTQLVGTVGRSWEQASNYNLLPESIPEPSPEDFKEFALGASSEKEDGGKIIVIPSSRIVLDQYVQRAPGNIEFVLNAVNDFASDGALTGIRQRAVNFYPLPELPDVQQDVFKYANILFLPGVFALFGAFYLVRRNKSA